MPMKFVCGVLMLTSLVWAEKLRARRIVEGFLAVKHGVQGVEWATKRRNRFLSNQLLCRLCFFGGQLCRFAQSFYPPTSASVAIMLSPTPHRWRVLLERR